MTTPPPSGPLVTAGVPLTSTIVVIDTPLLAAAAFVLGVLAAVVSLRALQARRRRSRGSVAPVPQATVPCAALGQGR